MCNASNCSHDALDDDFSDIFGEGLSGDADFARTALASTTSLRVFEETCPSCRGSGRFRSYTGRIVGECFKCKGAGKLRFKQSAEQRAKGREQAAKARDAKAAEGAAKARLWLAANPVEAEWLRDASARGFEFASDMLASLYKWGHLTAKQDAAVRNAAAKSTSRKAQWAAEHEAREANKAEVQIDRVAQAFAAAKASKLKWPKLHLGAFTLSLAGDASRNAGAIYVKDGETYLGKIVEGRFTRSRDCNDELEAAILAACADPHAAAVAYGLRTGSCSCCGRELTNAESIALGIGPICREKWGWA